MDNSNLPIPKLDIFRNIEIRKKQKEQKEKKEKPKKYLDYIFKKDDNFLKKYFD